MYKSKLSSVHAEPSSIAIVYYELQSVPAALTSVWLCLSWQYSEAHLGWQLGPWAHPDCLSICMPWPVSLGSHASWLKPSALNLASVVGFTPSFFVLWHGVFWSLHSAPTLHILACYLSAPATRPAFQPPWPCLQASIPPTACCRRLILVFSNCLGIVHREERVSPTPSMLSLSFKNTACFDI